MSHYIGELEGFPNEIVEKMLDEQERQTNKRDVRVFEKNILSSKLEGGFTWSNSVEGRKFWDMVINGNNFDVFFEKYPKKSPYPKVMLVSDDENFTHYDAKRVVFMEKNGRFIAWSKGETIEESNASVNACGWKYAKDIEEEPEIVELTIEQIAKKFNFKPEQIRIKP